MLYEIEMFEQGHWRDDALLDLRDKKSDTLGLFNVSTRIVGVTAMLIVRIMKLNRRDTM